MYVDLVRTSFVFDLASLSLSSSGMPWFTCRQALSRLIHAAVTSKVVKHIKTTRVKRAFLFIYTLPNTLVFKTSRNYPILTPLPKSKTGYNWLIQVSNRVSRVSTHLCINLSQFCIRLNKFEYLVSREMSQLAPNTKFLEPLL